MPDLMSKLVSPHGFDGAGPVPDQVVAASTCIARLRVKFLHQWTPGMDQPFTTRELQELFDAAALQAEWMRELLEARDALVAERSRVMSDSATEDPCALFHQGDPCLRCGASGADWARAVAALEIMPGAILAQVAKFGEVGRLHQPMSNVNFRDGKDRPACPECMGGIFAVDPEEPRPCGCWGLSKPVCTTCGIRYPNGHWARPTWPCNTWKALVDREQGE